jgi:hypothetical protein
MNSNLNADAGLPNILLGLSKFGDDIYFTQTYPSAASDIRPPLPSEPHGARQTITNLYHAGEGMTSHIDLLGRYGDGIIRVSFNSSCVMQFASDRAESGTKDKSARWDFVSTGEELSFFLGMHAPWNRQEKRLCFFVY